MKKIVSNSQTLATFVEKRIVQQILGDRCVNERLSIFSCEKIEEIFSSVLEFINLGLKSRK